MTYEPELSPEVARRRRSLRTGWTTGTCASAAAKAAAIGLVTGLVPDVVEVAIPSRRRVSFPVEAPAGRQVPTAVVLKDAGDDPDCTDGARMTAAVALAGPHDRASGAAEGRPGAAPGAASSGAVLPGAAAGAPGAEESILLAGAGIGVVTRPGLGLPVGAPAINPVPRRMILAALAEVTSKRLVVTFSVPGGEEMAAETTNERLGIVGGISILGTTGIVRPFSTASYRASVVQQIDVAAAVGQREVVLATGHRSEAVAARLRCDLDPVCFVEVGDFMGIALRRAASHHLDKVYVVAMAGKLTKLAAGVMMTHFHRSDVDTGLLEKTARQAGAGDRLVAAASETATARHFAEVAISTGDTAALFLLCESARAACTAHTSGKLAIVVWMSDFEGETVVAWAGEPPPGRSRG